MQEQSILKGVFASLYASLRFGVAVELAYDHLGVRLGFSEFGFCLGGHVNVRGRICGIGSYTVSSSTDAASARPRTLLAQITAASGGTHHRSGISALI